MTAFVTFIYIAGAICAISLFHDSFQNRISNPLVMLFAYFVVILIGLFLSPIMILIYIINLFY
jgi:hypothetical protein